MDRGSGGRPRGTHRAGLALLRRIIDDERIYPSPLFASLPRPELAGLLADLKVVWLGCGEVLFSEGEPGERFYVVLSGELEVVKAAATPRSASSSGWGGGLPGRGQPPGAGRRAHRDGAGRDRFHPAGDEPRRLRPPPAAAALIAFHVARVLGSACGRPTTRPYATCRQRTGSSTRPTVTFKIAGPHHREGRAGTRAAAWRGRSGAACCPIHRDPGGVRVRACMTPAKAVGRNFFASSRSAGPLGIAVGDVSARESRGSCSWPWRAACCAPRPTDAAPRDVLRRVNRHLMDLNEGEMSFTSYAGC